MWERAAEALRELAKVGNLVFPGLEQSARTPAAPDCEVDGGESGEASAQAASSDTEEEMTEGVFSVGGGGNGGHFQWPGPPDFREADEIEIQGRLAEIKEEADSTSTEM